MQTIDLIIVNKDSGELLRRCLDSVEQSEYAGGAQLRTVMVIDNASSDESADNLRPLLPLTVLHLKENIGFAAACNLASKFGSAEYLLFVNPDVQVFPATIGQAMEAVQRDGAALLGIRLLDENWRVTPSRMNDPQPKHFIFRALGLHRLHLRIFADYHAADQNQSGDADCVLGAFLLAKREAFEAVGGFDEHFFLYFEEIDLAKRTRAAGNRVVYRANIAALHTGGCAQSSPDPFRIEQSVRSRIFYAKRYFPPFSRSLLILFTFTVEPIIRGLHALFHGRNPFAVTIAYAKAAIRPHRPKHHTADIAMRRIHP